MTMTNDCDIIVNQPRLVYYSKEDYVGLKPLTQNIIKQMDIETLNFPSFIFQAVKPFIQGGEIK